MQTISTPGNANRNIIVIDLDIETHTRHQITETQGTTPAVVTGATGSYQTLTIRCLEPDYTAAQSLMRALATGNTAIFRDTINNIDVSFIAVENIRAEAVKTARAARWIVTFEGKIN